MKLTGFAVPIFGIVMMIIGVWIGCRLSKLAPDDYLRLEWSKNLSVDMIDVLEEKSLSGVTILALNPSFGGAYADACKILKEEDATFVEDIDGALYTIDIQSAGGAERSLIIVIADKDGLIEEQIPTAYSDEELKKNLLAWAREAGARHKRAILKMMDKEHKQRSYPVQNGVVPL